MKKYFLSFFLLAAFVFSEAQITVTEADFADPGNTVRMSVGVNDQGLDISTTGPNSNWDFSMLEQNSQKLDTFLYTFLTSPFYSFYFSNTSFNPHRASMAVRGSDFTPVPLYLLSFTKVFNFYYKSTSYYIQPGFGATMNSTTPKAVGFTHKDTLYRFPVEYGDADTSFSDYTVSVPLLGICYHEQTRVNTVDGWGSLTTPFGTHDALRIVSDITGTDSVTIDTLDFQYKRNSPHKREYKWIGNGWDEPLLQINTRFFGTFEFITSVVYRDSIHPVISSISDEQTSKPDFSIFPNPAHNNFIVISASELSNPTLTITDVCGKTILHKEEVSNTENVDAENWARGFYFVTLRSGNQQSVRRLVIE